MSELVLLKRITDGVLGAKLPAAGRFFEKQAILSAIGSHSARVQSHLKQLNF